MDPYLWSKKPMIRREIHLIAPTAQAVLFTQGGLELPLVASPAQVAQLLNTVSEMGAEDDPGGHRLSSRSTGRQGGAHQVRTDQVFGRVRVGFGGARPPRGLSRERFKFHQPPVGTGAKGAVSPEPSKEQVRTVPTMPATVPNGSPDSRTAPQRVTSSAGQISAFATTTSR
jgi:hypothetical protein